MRFIPNENDSPRYCDIGKFAGRWKIGGTIYLTDEEYRRIDIYDEMSVNRSEEKK